MIHLTQMSLNIGNQTKKLPWKKPKNGHKDMRVRYCIYRSINFIDKNKNKNNDVSHNKNKNMHGCEILEGERGIFDK